jgi:hypothetical protein
MRQPELECSRYVFVFSANLKYSDWHTGLDALGYDLKVLEVQRRRVVLIGSFGLRAARAAVLKNEVFHRDARPNAGG